MAQAPEEPQQEEPKKEEQPKQEEAPKNDEQTTDEGVDANKKEEEKKEESTTEQLKKQAKEKFGLAKGAAIKFGKQAKEATDSRLSMAGQIKQARISLEKFLDPELEIEQQIPVALLQGAKGIVFLSSIKASFGIGGSVGTGIIVAKLDYGEGWSAPCSIGLLGGQWGFNIGLQKTDFIIILRDENAVNTFSGKGQIKFGADASIAAGPLGRDAALALSVNDKGYAATVSYSMAKGLYVGVALEGQGIAVRADCNEKYYGKKAPVKDILTGNVENVENNDYDKIVQILTEYTKDQAISKEELQKLDDAKQPI